MNKNGIQADPAKTEAIIQMPWPVHQNVAEIQSFISMVNQLSKFIPNCDLLQPLTVLCTQQEKCMDMEPSQAEAFTTLKTSYPS